MSSIAGHAAAGITVYLSSRGHGRAPSKPALGLSVFLATCPDLDYLAVWLFGYSANPRFTHSLLFALAITTLVRVGLDRYKEFHLPATALAAASLSHPLLDLLVGAHPVPLLWPLPIEVTIPFGVLPSAGSLDPTNRYLWRNLLIELGVLLPVFAVWIVVARGNACRKTLVSGILIAPIWLLFVAWSVGLSR